LTKAEEVVLDTADSQRVIVWHVPPCDGQPVFLYFHGNGGSLRWRDERFHDLIADGSGLVALSYRGYGGSTGNPTEKGLIEDAKAAYAFSVAHYPAERLVLWGESLGSALALTLAAENSVDLCIARRGCDDSDAAAALARGNRGISSRPSGDGECDRSQPHEAGDRQDLCL
jgi:uncharacterized protein